MAEVFSDDLNLKIGDRLLNPLYHATRKPRAPVHAYACLRARQFEAARQLDERANCCK
jgi:hypothetical protein